MKIWAIAAALASVLPGTGAMAAPVCGSTPRIKQLQTDFADPDGRIMIAAHRAGHLHAPENSLAAIDEAVAAGADIVELDVKVSRDGVPFLMHDQRVERTTDGEGDAEQMDYVEIAGLRLKGEDGPPPTLVEALRQSCGRVLVDLDMKTDRVGPVVAAVVGLGMLDQVILFDSDSEVLRAARRIAPNLHVMTRLQGPASLEAVTADLATVTVVHGDAESLTPESRKRIEAMPARIWANSLGTMDDALAAGESGFCGRLSALLARGVGIIQTDWPALLKSEIQACARASTESSGESSQRRRHTTRRFRELVKGS